MLTLQEIRTFINHDAESVKKKHAKEGQRYYEAEHDIKDFRVFFINADGRLEEDKYKSNIKISHPFFTELVDQAVQYMLSGKDGFVRSDKPELQTHLDDYFNENEDFTAELYELITGCMVKGFEYAYAYKNKDGRTAFACADSLGVVEVKEKETDDGCAYVIYHYVDRISRDNKEIRRIQVWDDTQTWFYVQDEDGEIRQDADAEINPRPHVIWKEDGDEKTYYEGFGFIPFFRLDNNRKQHSGLKPIKALIDDYDLMSCGLSNNIQDSGEVLYVVKGFEGDNLDELMKNIRAKRHVGVSEEGGIDIRTVDIPYQARQAKLDLDEKNIYRFGMGFNSAQLGDGNITNVVIKSRYALLDLKCNKLEIHLKQFMRRLLKVVLDEINDANGTAYTQGDIYFEFEREVITNAADNADIAYKEAQTQQMLVGTLLNVASRFDDETLMQNICDVLDIDYDDIKDKLPREEDDGLYQARKALESTPTEPVGGDMIE